MPIDFPGIFRLKLDTASRNAFISIYGSPRRPALNLPFSDIWMYAKRDASDSSPSSVRVRFVLLGRSRVPSPRVQVPRPSRAVPDNGGRVTVPAGQWGFRTSRDDRKREDVLKLRSHS